MKPLTKKQMLKMAIRDGERERDLKNIVIPEMNELKLHADKGDVYYKYGKKQRMLESTYLITDSLNALDSTSLGRKIIQLQDMYNAIQ